MMYRLLIGFACVAAAVSLRAEVKLDTLTVGSVTYSNVTVFGANSTDLFFSSDSGVSNVKLKYLSPELQKQFHYDAKAAAKAEQAQMQEETNYQQSLEASMTAKVKAAEQERQAHIQAVYSKAGFGDPVSDDSQLWQTAPSMDFTNWVGAKPDLAGKFTLISVWSPKSASCRKWIPAINDLQRALAGKVQVVGVTTASEAEVEQSDPKIAFPCAIDPDGRFLSDAGVQSLPCVLLVDTNNIVRYMGHPAAITTNSLQALLKGTAE